MSDNLESYFKKHLSDETPGKDKWNIPSENVWDKTLPMIQKIKGLFIPLKYLYLFGGIILAGIIILIFLPVKDGDFEQNDRDDLTMIEKTAIDSQSSVKALNNLSPIISDSNQNTISSNSKNIFSEDSEIVSADNSQSGQGSTIPGSDNIINKEGDYGSSKPGKLTRNTETAYSGSKTQNRIKIATEDMIVGADYLIVEKINNFDNEISSLSQRSIANRLSEVDTSPLENKAIDSLVAIVNTNRPEESFINKGKFGIGAYFSPTYTSAYVSGELSTGLIETGNHFLYSSNWGFEIKYFISNRFALVAGIESSEVKSWSRSQVDFEYDLSTEHTMNTGEKENVSSVPMLTPFGEINTAITYRFPAEEEIPDGEIMQSYLDTHQEVRYLGIPLGIEYNFSKISGFSLFAETGIRYNRALRDATDFTSRILHEGHDMKVVAEEMTSQPSYTENYFDFYIGAGIKYQFSKAFQVNTSARYFRSITRVNLQENLSTYVQGFKLKAGIVYIF